MSFKSIGSLKKSRIEEGKRRASIGIEPEIECDDFDEVLKLVGAKGKYQKWLLYGFVCPFTAIMPFFILNTIFMLYEPNHWCHVPGRPTNMSMEEWRNHTIPMEVGPDGVLKQSQCRMYSIVNDSSIKNQFDIFTTIESSSIVVSNQITDCNTIWGWDYDRSDYTQTLISEFNWVCSKSDYGTKAFTLFAVGNCVGTILFGWAGDKFGRKYIFFLTIFINLAARMISLFIAKYFYYFLLMQFLVGTSFPMMYIAPFTTIAEISDREYRSRIYAVSWMIWVVGICALPLIAFICADWFLIGLATTIPGVLLFLYYKYLPESPRLLLSKGNIQETIFYLKKIAKVNGTLIECNRNNKLRIMVNQIEKKQDENKDRNNVGIWALFSRIEIAKYTIYLCLVWSINGLIYYGITLNTTAMAGNQFINFFILSIIELPAGFIGGYLVEKTGRRWTQALFLVICAVMFGGAGIAVINPNLSVLVIVLVVIAKFAVSITSLVVNLQANEIFPTQLRATGVGLVSTVAGLFAIGGPIIIYLGKLHAAAPYIALGILSLLGTVCSTLLPETLGQSLPETIEESNKLGQKMKFWSFLPHEDLLDHTKTNHDEANDTIKESKDENDRKINEV